MRGIYIERVVMVGLLVLALFLTSKLRAEPAVMPVHSPTGNSLNLD